MQSSLPFAGFGLSLAAFTLLSFHAGWILRGFETESLGIVFSIMAGIPVASLLVVIAREKVARFVLLVMTIMFEASGYVVSLSYPNNVMDVGYWDVPALTISFAIFLGCMLSLLMLSAIEPTTSIGSLESRIKFLVASMLFPGTIVGFAILVATQDWSSFVILAMIIAPVAVIFQLMGDKKPGTKKTNIQDQGIDGISSKDPIKGLKLVLFLLVALVNVILMIGLDGIALEPNFYVTNNWLFYIFMAGGANFILLAMMLASTTIQQEKPTPSSKKRSMTWLAIVIVQFVMWLIAISCELLIPGYHGSALAQVTSGFTAGIIIVTTLQVVVMQQPPRHAGANTMLMIFFLGLSIVLGQYLKIVPTSLTDFRGLVKYIPYVFGIEFLLVISLSILLIIPIIVKRKP
ncbi:MAG TPA: hypothetical protein VKM55_14570 [Candidatus Lokiarchaeia archaeon]|nr:hypothetical protein [Candidatus Lokiarchaeia archaeon]